MELIVEPLDGVKPIIETMNSAKKSLDLIVFRFGVKARRRPRTVVLEITHS